MKDILTMKNIVKKFGKGHTEVTALKDINFTVKQGEFVSIIGPSGSGKSTFLTISVDCRIQHQERSRLTGNRF